MTVQQQTKQYKLLEEYARLRSCNPYPYQAVTYVEKLQLLGVNKGYARHLVRHINYYGLDFSHIDDLADEFAELQCF